LPWEVGARHWIGLAPEDEVHALREHGTALSRIRESA
jgi:hypothetical protein